MKKRGQAWGFDLTVAMFIFFAGMLFLFVYVLNLPSEQDEVFETLRYEGRVIGDGLLSEGFPEDWNSSTVVSIGLFVEGKVDETKLKNFYDFVNSDYSHSKRLFNVLNDYYVFFGEPVSAKGTLISGIGLAPSNEENLVRVTRVVAYEDGIETLNIVVWN